MVQVEIKWARKIPGTEAAEVWARVRFNSAGDRLYSRDLGLKTILDLVVTPEYPGTAGVFVTKYLENPGELDNYASLWSWTATDTAESAIGSTWVDIHALGQ